MFILGLAGWSIPCLAFAVGNPAPNMTMAGSAPVSETDPALTPVTEQTADANTSGWAVQVGAYADRGLAQARLKAVSAMVSDYDLQDAQFVDTYVNDGGRMLYRAQFIISIQSTAKSLCASLGAIGENCFISHRGDQRPERSSSTASANTLPALDEKASQSSSTNAKLALASIRPVGDDELQNARGGFSVGGINFNFGASIQTMVNGQLALQTNLQWTPTGAVVTQLQGLGTQIQTQVASTLASAGINVPTTTASTPATVSANAATQPVSTTASTVGTAPVTNTASAQTSSAGAATLTGGSITSSPLTSTNPPSIGVVNIPTTAGAPTSTTTLPVSFVNLSPTSSNGGSTSGPAASSTSVLGLQASTGNAPSTTNTPSLTANSFVTTAVTAPSNAGAVSPANAPNTPAQGSISSQSGNSGTSPTVLSGVQIQSPTGSTDILANVANGQIQNLILNSASNQNIVQNTNITLTIYNFTSWQQMLAQHALSAQLTNQLQAASGFTMGH